MIANCSKCGEQHLGTNDPVYVVETLNNSVEVDTPAELERVRAITGGEGD